MDISSSDDDYSDVDLETEITGVSALHAGPIAGVWAKDNAVTCFNVRWRGVPATKDSKFKNQSLETLSWNNIIGSRKLVCESHAVFYNTKDLEPPLSLNELVGISQAYRASLQMLSESFDAQSQKNTAMEKEYSEYAVIDMVWHSAEIMLFNRSSVLPGLLKWVQVHFVPSLDPEFQAQCKRDIQNDTYTSTLHPQYWQAIYSYAIRGMTEQTLQLLHLHPDSENAGPDSIYYILDELLESMPMINMDVADSMDFNNEFTEWSSKVASMAIRSDLFVNRMELRRLLQILSGDVNAIASVSNDWVTMMIGLVLYKYPTYKSHQVKSVMEQVQQISEIQLSSPSTSTGVSNVAASSFFYRGSNNSFLPTIRGLPESVDRLVQAIFNLQIPFIIHGVIDIGNPWFCAHFIDLFSKYDATPFEIIPMDTKGCTHHERAILEYVSTLTSNKFSLRLISDYLSACPTYGKDYLVYFISKEPIETEKQAIKLLSMCEYWKLYSKQASDRIKLSIASKKRNRGNLASAISWSSGLQAQQLSEYLLDEVFIPVSKIEQQQLQSHLTKLNLIVAATINVKSSFYATLDFIRVYASALKFYAENDLKEVLVLLGTALNAGSAPKRLWIPILNDISRIIEKLKSQSSDGGSVFSANECFVLLRCLEEAESWLSASVKLNDSNFKDETSQIRLMLSHQLSDAIMAST